MEFDSWQDGAGRLILAKRADGSYAASIGGVVMSIPRQVGKTFLIGAIVFALCLLNPGLTVLWTAHRLRTANETFAKMQAFARRKKVSPHVARVILGSGDEAILFHNGSRILFGARERGFGRGFDDVDIEVFDEAQILTENAVDDMLPAMNTAANPLPIFIGTPPKPTDSSQVFTMKRNAALSGQDPDTAFVEFSADLDCDPEDRAQWALGNPSYPGRTPESAMLRLKKNLTIESFMREGLGIWDPVAAAVIDPEVWAELVDRTDNRAPGVAFSIVVDDQRKWSSICAAGKRRDGRHYVDLIKTDRGTKWVVEAALELTGKHSPSWVAVRSGEPLTQALEDAGLPVLSVGPADAASACGLFIDAIDERSLSHRGLPQVAVAVAAADKRISGQAFTWKSKNGADISPLWGLTLALYAAGKPAKEPARSGRVW